MNTSTNCTADGDWRESPTALGFPHPEWRKNQLKALERTVRWDKRFKCLALPAGFGKSLTYMAAAAVGGLRTAVVVATRGLQDQLIEEFGACGAFDIRGRANYTCVGHGSYGRDGKLRTLDCDYAQDRCVSAEDRYQCTYKKEQAAASKARLVVPNYAYWMNVNRYGDGLVERTEEGEVINPFELLVCDEVHLAAKALESFLKVVVRFQDVDLFAGTMQRIPENEDDIESPVGWGKWAESHLKNLRQALKDHKQEGDRISAKRAERLLLSMSTVAKMKSPWWVVELDDNRYPAEVAFTPLWPGKSAPQALFCNIPKVVLVSATMNHKTVSDLGIANGEYELVSYPCSFPVARCPVYAVRGDTGVRMNRHTTDTDMARWVEAIDCIIAARLDRKGIVHTVSYSRQKYFMENSAFRDSGILLYNKGAIGDDEDSVVELFRKAEAPKVFVSPSLGTGWSFAYEECEYQVISKIPFPDTSNKVAKKRRDLDKQWPSQEAMIALAQKTRRGMRSEKDRCETIIVDTSVGWFMAQNRGLAPEWLRIRSLEVLPEPPPKLAMAAVEKNT